MARNSFRREKKRREEEREKRKTRWRRREQRSRSVWLESPEHKHIDEEDDEDERANDSREVSVQFYVASASSFGSKQENGLCPNVNLVVFFVFVFLNFRINSDDGALCESFQHEAEGNEAGDCFE